MMSLSGAVLLLFRFPSLLKANAMPRAPKFENGSHVMEIK